MVLINCFKNIQIASPSFYSYVIISTDLIILYILSLLGYAGLQLVLNVILT